MRKNGVGEGEWGWEWGWKTMCEKGICEQRPQRSYVEYVDDEVM